MLEIDDSKSERSWLDEALAHFAADNDAFEERTRALLGRIIDEPEIHGRLINTLSMLEHMGSYKIMATQHSVAIDQPTLRHVAEEAHHAFFMKRQAEKTNGRPMEYLDRDLLAPATARMYFQRLEAMLSRLLRESGSARAIYLYMSLIVEFRALWFYRVYQQSLNRAGHSMSLKRILGEEQSHLIEMAKRLDSDDELSDSRVAAFLSFEQKLFERMLDALEQAVRQPLAA